MLNQDQAKIYVDAINTIKKGEQVYEYEGKAGTGKTFLLHEICRGLGISMQHILPMAFTGAAASVLRKKGFPTATTLHSGLFKAVEVPNPLYKQAKINSQFGVPDISPTIVKFIPKEKSDLKGVQLIVIDEGYMCPDYMKPIVESYDIPIIVTGDRHQLPPIKAKPAYLWKENLPSLKQIMRQELNNPIVILANMILDGVEIQPGFYGNRVLVIEEQDLTDEMILNSTMVLCGRNATRDKINQHIREILGHTTTLPEYGERIICRKNNHAIEMDGIELCNGLIGYCISQPFLSPNSKVSYEMDFLPDIAFNPFRNLICDYEYFTSPSKVRSSYNGFYNYGERFEFAYCITTHLAQGSEANRGIYIKEYMRRDMQVALDYTGVTRFKKFMIMVLPRIRKFYQF